MAVKIHTEDGDECEHDENQRSPLMVSFRSVGPFFGSIRAAPINGTTFSADGLPTAMALNAARLQ